MNSPVLLEDFLRMNENDVQSLRERIGNDYWEQRLRAQTQWIQYRKQRRQQNLHVIIQIAKLTLHSTGLHQQGQRNALDLRVHENHVILPNLPKAFDDTRILHLSDLHFGGYPGFGFHIAAALANHQFDLAVLTGDYRFRLFGQTTHVTAELNALIPFVRRRARRFGVYGILGNHDFIETVPFLEELGVRTLVNEAVVLRDGQDSLWLAGLDDVHYYQMHNFGKALRHIPPEATRLLLVHSPEVISQASTNGFCFYMTGHTHGGQICLPGGTPLAINTNCARRYMAGAWHYNGMAGYTSRGTGSSGVFARFFCPPEAVIHVLKRK